MGLTVCVLRGFRSQLALWRLLTGQGLWHYERVAVSDEAVSRWLGAADPSPLAAIFAQLTAQLSERVAPWQEHALAPFATVVVALDATRLDPVARTLPALRSCCRARVPAATICVASCGAPIRRRTSGWRPGGWWPPWSRGP